MCEPIRTDFQSVDNRASGDVLQLRRGISCRRQWRTEDQALVARHQIDSGFWAPDASHSVRFVASDVRLILAIGVPFERNSSEPRQPGPGFPKATFLVVSGD